MTKNNASSKLQKHKTFKSNYLNSRGLDIKKSYSSFWMNDTRFGPSTINAPATGDLGKLIKLNSYRRAITNFVKIVTKQDIPVNWSDGYDSYTNGKAITISTDIKDNTFDVTVGLALHEASHVILTDFECASTLGSSGGPIWDIIRKSSYASNLGSGEVKAHLFAYLNWVEDRRIDHYVFSTSPGYKAYYHKLYDYYWNNAHIESGFKSKKLQDPLNKNHWDFHIINSISNKSNPKALPRLDEILAIIDLPNIARLQSTQDSLKVAIDVLTIVYEVMDAAAVKPKMSPPKPAPDADQDNSGSDDSQSQDEQDSTSTAPEAQDEQSNDQSDESDSDSNSGDSESESDSDSEDDQDDLGDTAVSTILHHLDKQKKFLKGETGKKPSTKNLQKQLETAAKSGVDVQIVGDEITGQKKCYIYDYTVGTKISELAQLQHEIMTNDRDSYKARKAETDLALEGSLNYFRLGTAMTIDPIIELGLNMGSLLGKKLQLHNESRERVDNRLYTGKIDGKRIAHAGYDIESVFKQVRVDKCKNANIHISLDASGSMGGEKWHATVQTTMAIAKAAKYAQGISVQVSLRTTNSFSRTGEDATLVLAYDSTKNPISHLVTVMRQVDLNSTTPEGLCFEGLLKKGMLKRGTDTMDSYFLNISDGQPSMGGYGGTTAINHTRNVINKMKAELNIKVIAFWIEYSSQSVTLEQVRDRFNQPHGSGACFRMMYGNDATVVDSKSAMSIAQQLNKRFLKHA